MTKLSALALQGKRVLRLTSNLADAHLSSALTGLGAEIVDCRLYVNQPKKISALPPSEAILLASASAVAALVQQVPREKFCAKILVPIGKPTVAAMKSFGLAPFVLPDEATAAHAIAALAARLVAARMEDLSKKEREEIQ